MSDEKLILPDEYTPAEAAQAAEFEPSDQSTVYAEDAVEDLDPEIVARLQAQHAQQAVEAEWDTRFKLLEFCVRSIPLFKQKEHRVVAENALYALLMNTLGVQLDGRPDGTPEETGDVPEGNESDSGGTVPSDS